MKQDKPEHQKPHFTFNDTLRENEDMSVSAHALTTNNEERKDTTNMAMQRTVSTGDALITTYMANNLNSITSSVESRTDQPQTQQTNSYFSQSIHTSNTISDAKATSVSDQETTTNKQISKAEVTSKGNEMSENENGSGDESEAVISAPSMRSQNVPSADELCENDSTYLQLTNQSYMCKCDEFTFGPKCETGE